MKNGRYQIKDILDEEIYEAIRKSKKHYMENRFNFSTPSTMPGVILNPTFPFDYLRKYPERLVLAKMQKMVDNGKLECGVSLRTAWIVGEENYLERKNSKEKKNE